MAVTHDQRNWERFLKLLMENWEITHWDGENTDPNVMRVKMKLERRDR